jgi:hypothetical protein
MKAGLSHDSVQGPIGSCHNSPGHQLMANLRDSLASFAIKLAAHHKLTPR